MRIAIYLTLIVLFSTSCNVLQPIFRPISKTFKSEPKRLAVSGEDSQSPFTLAVLDELHDGERLHVHAQLTAKTDWPADAVQARLIGLSNGVKVVEQDLQLSQVVSGVQAGNQLQANKDYDLLFNVPSASVSGYQLELFWEQGQKSSGSGRAFALELRQLEVEERLHCSTTPCQIAFSLKGEFFNNSQNMLSSAKIAVGFVFVPKGKQLDLSVTMPENEEQVSIAGLNLAAGQSKPFRLNIKSVVPERSDGAFVPLVRVVQFS